MKKKSVVGKNEDNLKQMDFPLLITIIILLCIGLVMMASASSYYSLNTYSDSNYLLSRQVILAFLGIVVMFVLSKINYSVYKKLSFFAYGISLLLMIAVLIPGIGQKSSGATRWIDLGISTFQPSELMKITLVLAVSTYIAINYKRNKDIKLYIVPILLLFAVMLTMFFQKHLSGTIVMIVGAVSVIFASGFKIKLRYIIIFTIIVALVVTAFILSEEFRVKRVLSFLNPEEDIRGGNWQSAQSLYAIGSGGIFGRGLGQSRQKYLWLPEVQNDFIFSVLGEEFGLVGTMSVLLAFSFLIYRGYLIAMKSKDIYGSLIATGITSVFALQILVNIAVVTSSMPVTGMPLPFFSYGGTALFINLCAMGVLLNVSRNCSR